MTRKGPKGARSVDGHQPNWSPPLSLWPSSRPLPIKPNPLSTTLPLTPSLPCTAPLPLLPPSHLRFLIRLSVLLSYPPDPSHTIIPTPIPAPCRTRPSLSKRVLPRISSRSPVSPTRSPICPKPRASRTSRSTPHPCPGNMPRRAKQKCVLPFLHPPSLQILTSPPLSRSLKRHCRTMSGRRKRSRMRLP